MTVYLVGAGPGDPGLLTRRGAELLGTAEVVVHDRLVDPALLTLANPSAELVDVGKRPGPANAWAQEQINALLVDRGAEGRLVVRLKGGDPFVFGRGGEEAQALERAGVPWEVVPGVSSAFSVPAAGGIPVTFRGQASSVTVVTGHLGDPGVPGGVDWEALARAEGTLVVLMGMATREALARRLIDAGRSPQTPAAVVERGTTVAQRVTRTTLEALGQVAAGSPGVVVVGPVAGIELHPGTGGPLRGTTVVVTRPAHQAGASAAALERAGAQVVVAPMTAIEDPEDQGGSLAMAAEHLGDYRWIAFTSANAVHRLMGQVADLRAMGGCGLAVVGGASAAALAEHRLVPDLVAEESSAAGLVEAFPSAPPSGDHKVLYPRAAGARPTVAAGLAAKGWQVDQVEAYRTVPAPAPVAPVWDLVARADVVTFAAPSAVEAYLALRDDQGRPLAVPPVVACIGPVTAQAAGARGLQVQVVAAGPSPGALVEALVAWRRRPGATGPGRRR